MKILSHDVLDNTLILHFDINFTHITYTKMSSGDRDKKEWSFGELECEQIELKYSKNKNTLNIITNSDIDFLVLLITKIDKHSCYYSYYINLNTPKNKLNNNNSTVTFDQTQLNFSNTSLNTSFSKSLKIHPIKNQNIFANIKKKGIIDQTSSNNGDCSFL
jgi:hypothetical protein